MDTGNLIRKHALKNAVEHEGRASPGSIVGRVIGEAPELKAKVSELMPEINNIVRQVNSLSLEEQKKELLAIDSGALKKEKKKKEMPELRNAIMGKVVTRMPPEPSKYLHIGHALSFLINYVYAKKYEGKCILRFDDTNPEKGSQEYVDSGLDDINNYLEIKPDRVLFASDDVGKMITLATELVEKGKAYVCACPKEKMSELREKGKACECREKSIEMSLSEWKRMQDGGFEEGERTLRLKIDMKSSNYVMRDPVIFRIVRKPHFRQKDKYKAWPMYDFESALEDSWCGITHILRSNEFGRMREELQDYIKDLFGLPKQTVIQYGRFNIRGASTQGREIRERIEKGELLGWDDPRLVTLKALKRRGIFKETFFEMVKHVGLSKTPTNIDWSVVQRFNRKLADKKVRRMIGIAEPVRVRIAGAPERAVSLKFHPSQDFGSREIKTGEGFILDKKDYDKMEEGKLYRLMDCLNFRKEKGKLVFDSVEHERFKQGGESIMHWLPDDEKQTVKVKMMMPDASLVEMIAEKAVSTANVGEVVQFERFGFARKDSEDSFWYSHK
jgi:glutamyl-tRNA synthetase